MNLPRPLDKPRRLAVFLVLPLVAALVLASCSDGKQGQGARTAGDRPAPVTIAEVIAGPAPIEYDTFGTVKPIAAVDVKTQITDILRTVHFKKGDIIAKGQLLFSIDRRASQAALDQAKSNFNRDTVQAKYAQESLRRETDLLKRGIASNDEYDQAKAAADAAEATVKADAAAVKTATLQLAYCAITSPIHGRVGDLLVTEGNLVKANDQTLVTINQIKPIDLFFSVPQNQLESVKKYQAAGSLKVIAVLGDGPADREIGRLTFIDNNIDAGSGTILIGATFPNDDERLWPGQYVRIHLVLTVQQNATLVPSAAVQVGQDGQYVFVVQPDDTVKMCPVVSDRTFGDSAVIQSGLTPGERVVTDGQLLLEDGKKIAIKNSPAAATSPGSVSTAPAAAEPPPNTTTPGETTAPAAASSTTPASQGVAQ